MKIFFKCVEINKPTLICIWIEHQRKSRKLRTSHWRQSKCVLGLGEIIYQSQISTSEASACSWCCLRCFTHLMEMKMNVSHDGRTPYRDYLPIFNLWQSLLKHKLTLSCLSEDPSVFLSNFNSLTFSLPSLPSIISVRAVLHRI